MRVSTWRGGREGKERGHADLSTTTTGLSLLVITMRDFQILQAASFMRNREHVIRELKSQDTDSRLSMQHNN
eukprot:3044064-Rhodomonas_salina.6